MNIRNNILKEVKSQFVSELTEIYGESESESLLNILVEHYFGMSRIDLSMNSGKRISESEILILNRAVKELKRMKPVQYITGSVEFSDIILKVDENVLIPRQETEELVNLVIKNEKAEGLKILDIGTGSGCIAIALSKKLKNSGVSAMDISEKAIQIAKYNAKFNNTSVKFVVHDILRNSYNSPRFNEPFNIIISNPPYVTTSDKEKMKANVLNYEPELALFVEDKDPLIYYRAILEFSEKYLTSGGRIYFEINEAFPDEMYKLTDSFTFTDINIFKDIHNRYRMLSAVKKG